MSKIAIFEGKEIRAIYVDEELYYSIVDIIKVLTDSNEPKRYWSDLKNKLISDGFQPYENIVRLKIKAQDGKKKINGLCRYRGFI